MTALLTTVIGLIGVYIAFALAASWINEQIATFLQLRSKTLDRRHSFDDRRRGGR